jgi:protein associated with RNAse G/E
MQALIRHAAEAGYTKLLSRVFVENTASRRLLQSLGFREVGVYHHHGQLDGVWRDVVIVERLLDEPDSLWNRLAPDTRITVIKTTFAGEQSARYEATVVASDHPDWTCLEAPWTLADSSTNDVMFERGGTLREYFSPMWRFNVFQVFRRNGTFGGIYANVTAPARLELDQHGSLVLVWEDHWLDVVKGANGNILVLDEDEFEESGLENTQPHLATMIRAAKDELFAQITSGVWDA